MTGMQPAEKGPMFKAVNAWSVRLVEPLAVPIVRLCLALRLSPNAVTVLSFAIALGAGAVFWFVPGYLGLAIGALVYEFGFLFDLADGAVARLTGRVSRLGARLDVWLDKVKKLACLCAILHTHWWLGGRDAAWLLIGIVLVLISYGLQFALLLLSRRKGREPDTLRAWLLRHSILDWWHPLDGQFLLLTVAPLCTMLLLPWIWGLVCVLFAVKLVVELMPWRCRPGLEDRPGDAGR